MPDSPYADSLFVIQYNFASGAVAQLWTIADSYLYQPGLRYNVGANTGTVATILYEREFGVDLSHAGYPQLEDGTTGLLGYWAPGAAAVAPHASAARNADALFGLVNAATQTPSHSIPGYHNNTAAFGGSWSNFSHMETLLNTDAQHNYGIVWQ